MPRKLVQPQPWTQSNTGDRIPYSDKVDRDDPARSYVLITLHRMELAGVDIDDRAVEIATKLGRWAYEAATPKEVADQALRQRVDEVEEKRQVYYVRCGHLIKIGTTANLGARFSQIRPNEILALETGGQALEAERHRQFAELRASGEYFHPGPALQRHIAELRATLGPPQWVGSIVPDGQNYFPAV